MKAIFFDFDGTLTQNDKNSWSVIWQVLNKQDEASKLYKMFLDEKISYDEWSRLTCLHFKLNGLNIEILKQATQQIKLIDGIKETFEKLKKQGVSINIVSGSIKQVIEYTLGDLKNYIDNIYANDFKFNEKGYLTDIEVTKYDYAGKCQCVSQFLKSNNLNPREQWFVGNSSNDEWVYKSGCNTLCINPDGADIANKDKWNKVLEKVENLSDILSELNITKNLNNCENSK